MPNELKNSDSSDNQYTSQQLDDMCAVCAPGITDPKKKAECAKLVRNPKAAETLCGCWALQKPQIEYYLFYNDIWNECNTQNSTCKIGEKSIPNPLASTPGQPEMLTAEQKCYDKTVPGCNHDAWTSYQQAASKWDSQYAPGAPYSHKNADGTDRGVGQTHTSGWCPPWGTATNEWNYCGTVNNQATGRRGNGTYCSNAPDYWDATTGGPGWGWVKSTSGDWDYDASFMSKPGCTNSSNCGSAGSLIKGPGDGRVWKYEVDNSDAINAAWSNGQGGFVPGKLQCKMKATQSWIVPNPGNRPTYTQSQTAADCCGAQPTAPAVQCCINSVTIDGDITNSKINIKQSCDPNASSPSPSPSPSPGPGSCGKCKHGACVNGVCQCSPMYKGDNCDICKTDYFKCGDVDGAILNVDECKCECGPGYWGIGDQLCFKSDAPWYNKIRDWFILLWKNIDKDTKLNKILLLVGVSLLLISLILLSIMIPGMIPGMI